MTFREILELVKEILPIPVIVAIVCCIMLVSMSKKLVSIVEEYLEEKYQRQIKIFDHKKIWLSVLWCVVLTVTLALAGQIAWSEFLLYLFEILGASTFFYEAFLKKLGIDDD